MASPQQDPEALSEELKTLDISTAATTSSKPGLEALPVELMRLVTQSTDAKGKAILSGDDLCNLRSTSRRIKETTYDDWTKRCFTTRKHMLSRASLQCLLSISTDPVFRNYVEEVAIGPEHVNGYMAFWKLKNCRSKDQEEDWPKTYGPKHAKLVEEQEEFDASDEAVGMLKSALRGFPTLKHIRIDSYPKDSYLKDPYPNESEDAAAWTEAWGSKRILREMGWGAYGHWAGPQWALRNEGKACGGKLHGHIAKVLSALRGIEDRKDWTLEVALHTMGLGYEERPFDISSSDWTRVQHRVTHLKFIRTFEIFEKHWITSLLQSVSGNLRSLTLCNENVPTFLRWTQFPTLTHLDIRSSPMASPLFKRFLFKHRKTLQSLHICGLNLYGWYDDEDAFEPSDFEDVEDSDSDEDDVVQEVNGRKLKPGLVELKDATWFTIFKQLMMSPCLTSVRFARLSQYQPRFNNMYRPGMYTTESVAEHLTGGFSLAAEGDEVVTSLGRAVKERIAVEMLDRDISDKIWFSDGCSEDWDA
ncbi:hypothetical protein J4E85_000230 [Alternaria conjuncta]|uniref:uncharacterized protein n=1 Tax=Alternaria conjuncta TaxID=181017 RepID=UPI0022204F04|nr:uncharacterized protein J4E85_000230 [Alternaria conjuncta]KAI4937794.1 hypothetical protein J4E85_000230 [Alternaria conjuncta]